MLRIKIIFIALMALFLFPVTAFAQTDFDYKDFSLIPVSHQGRVKPLGRVAQLTLKQIAQIDLSDEQAAAWLATILFDPHSADTPPIFYIGNPHLIHVLQLPPPASTDAAFYNFHTLNRAFTQQAELIIGLRDMKSDELHKDQRDLLALYADITYYEQLKHSLTLLLPLKREHHHAPIRFIDAGFIDAGKDKDKTTSLPDTILPDAILHSIAAQGALNQSFRVIPFRLLAQDTTWLAPWEYWKEYRQQDRIMDDDHNDADGVAIPPLLALWSQSANAYIAGEPDVWKQSVQELLSSTLAQAHDTLLPYRLKAELVYHALSPYFYSLCLYLFAFIAAFLAQWKLLYPARIILTRATWVFFLGGLGLHLTGLAMRIFILQRPPVSNLYESILFVGAMLTAMGLWYIRRKGDTILLPALALMATALQLLGFALNQDGDSLQVLQAVLDTKFWLATHVIIITLGYALCLATALLAHVALFVSSRHPDMILHQHRFYKRSLYFSLLALLFISIGTLLGGVWADQSWGRFWGWDPKENGALLIILWLVWLLHGRISRHLGDRGFIIGLALLNIIVGISWIGVNLLGIGLHSYGFINGSALSLLFLCLAEIIFFALCAFLYCRRHLSSAS